MSNQIKETFYLYKGQKIYHPEKIVNTLVGKTYYQRWPPEMSSVPPSGFKTKEAYYESSEKAIDSRIKYGHWTDFF